MANEQLIDRRCRLTVAAPVDTPNDFRHTTTILTQIDAGKTTGDPGLRVKFKIEKSREKQPNTSELEIYNLSPSSRSALQKRGVKVLVEAGYASTGLARYFAGDVRTIDHVRDGSDWVTKLRLGDGERAWRFARVSESFAPGTYVVDAIRTVARKTGLDLGNLEDVFADVKTRLDQGWAVCGSTVRELDKLVTMIGMSWSIQDGALQFLPPDGTLSQSVPELTPTSGLIGSPEMGTPPAKGKPALLKLKGLLFPTKPGAKVKLKSERYDGFVRVEKVSFTGDTHGGEWYTDADAAILKK